VAGLGDRLRSGEPAARELEFRTDDLAGSFGSAGAQSVRSQAMPLHTKQRPVSRACHQVVHIDTAQNKSLGLQCGSAADTLAIVDTSPLYEARAGE
jgi:hypothetical protein